MPRSLVYNPECYNASSPFAVPTRVSLTVPRVTLHARLGLGDDETGGEASGDGGELSVADLEVVQWTLDANNSWSVVRVFPVVPGWQPSATAPSNGAPISQMCGQSAAFHRPRLAAERHPHRQTARRSLRCAVSPRFSIVPLTAERHPHRSNGAADALSQVRPDVARPEHAGDA